MEVTSMLKNLIFKMENSDRLTIENWLWENVFFNIINPPIIQTREVGDDEPLDTCIDSRPFTGDYFGKWEDCDVEDLCFDNFGILDINLETNTLTLNAGGDCQNPIKFTITLQADGKWKYNDDAKLVGKQLSDDDDDDDWGNSMDGWSEDLCENEIREILSRR